MGKFNKRLLDLIGAVADGNVSVFAEKTGIPRSTLHNYTKGRLPHSEHLVRMRETYSANIDWLLTGNGPMQIFESIRDDRDGYDLYGGHKPENMREKFGLDKGTGWGRCTRMLFEIFDSRDADTIQKTVDFLNVMTGRAETEVTGIDEKAAPMDLGRRMALAAAQRHNRRLDENQLNKLTVYLNKLLQNNLGDIEEQIIQQVDKDLLELL